MLMRICLLTGLCATWIFCWKLADVWTLPWRTEHAVTSQFDANPVISNDVIQTATMDVYAFGWIVLILIGIPMISGDLKRLMMSKLRSEATPHIQTVVSKVTSFFETRGLTITNLGISGGFIYTDKKISDRMTELFVAEQGEAIATAKANSNRRRQRAWPMRFS